MTQNDSKCLLIAHQKPGQALCVFSCANTTRFLCWCRGTGIAACSVSLQSPPVPGDVFPAHCGETPSCAGVSHNTCTQAYTFPTALMGKEAQSHSQSQ